MPVQSATLYGTGKFLSAHGYPQEADEVFIAMHESERKQLDP
jgi:hypothetical protein